MDLRQYDRYATRMRKMGWKVAKAGGAYVYIKSMGIFGAMAKIQRARYPLEWTEVESVLGKNRVWIVKYEPDLYDLQEVKGREVDKELSLYGYRRDGWAMLPTRTVVVDLTVRKDRMLESFDKDCRYCIRKAEGAQGVIKHDDFCGFYKAWKKGTKLKGLWMPQEREFEDLIEVFGENCFCLTYERGGEVVAGVVTLVAGKGAYYFYSTTLPGGKEVNAPYLLVWEAMQRAKGMGCRTWDFEGIYDARWPNKEWLGFSRFKKSFGGKEVEYLGSFTRLRWPW